MSARPRSVWAERAPWLLGGLAIAALLGAGMVPTPETVSGIAVVHDSRVRAVHSPVDGAVVEVFVRPGDLVALGDPLLRLRDPVVEVDYRGTQRRVEQALVTRLRARAASDSDAPVRAVVDELVRARAQAQLYTVRAEVAGEVVGVRSRPGDEVEARAVLATVCESGPRELIAAVDIPSHAAEKVRVGAKVLISFGDGHDAKRTFEVVSRSEEAVSEAVEQGGNDSQRNQLRFWARFVDDRPGSPAPKTGMTGQAELVYRDRSLFSALADIMVGEGL